MTREQRLQSARAWLVTQTGREPARIGASYRRWYGVDWPCAIAELSRLGVAFDPKWVEQLQRNLEGQHRARAAQRAAKLSREESQRFNEDSDEYFAFIAGYTPGGAAFGITWEEWEILERDNLARDEPDPF